MRYQYFVYDGLRRLVISTRNYDKAWAALCACDLSIGPPMFDAIPVSVLMYWYYPPLSLQRYVFKKKRP